MLTERELILANLDAFVRQRSGLDARNYDSFQSARAEQRSITRDMHDYRALRSAVQWRDGIDAAALKEAFRAFSGRLTWDGRRLDYCTGQYFPTEYRKAACAVLASALWTYTREHAMPEPTFAVEGKDCATLAVAKERAASFAPVFVAIEERYSGLTAGDWLRRHFRREFGRGIASRWFS